MRIFKEKPELISEEAVWVCIDGYYMYIEDSFWKLVKTVITEWRHDRHICG